MADLKKQLKAIKKLLGGGRDLQLSDADALRYQDILFLLEQRGYLHDFQVDGANWYRKMEDFDGFEDWLNEEIKDEKRVTRREWAIGIVCAIIGCILRRRTAAGAVTNGRCAVSAARIFQRLSGVNGKG